MPTHESVSLPELARQWRMTLQELSSCCIDKEGKIAEQVNLSRMEARLLSLLVERRGMLPSDAAAEMGLVRSRITRIVEGLTEKGLINCRSGGSDGRCRFLEATLRGKRAIQTMQERERKFHLELLKMLPTEMRTRTLRELQVIMDSMKTVKAAYTVSIKNRKESKRS